jgi:hypothetical protein
MRVSARVWVEVSVCTSLLWGAYACLRLARVCEFKIVHVSCCKFYYCVDAGVGLLMFVVCFCVCVDHVHISVYMQVLMITLAWS